MTCPEHELGTEVVDWDPLLHAVATSVAAMQWGTAAKHLCGEGLECGTDLPSGRARLRPIERRGAVATVADWGQWTRAQLSCCGIECSFAFGSKFNARG